MHPMTLKLKTLLRNCLARMPEKHIMRRRETQLMRDPQPRRLRHRRSRSRCFSRLPAIIITGRALRRPLGLLPAGKQIALPLGEVFERVVLVEKEAGIVPALLQGCAQAGVSLRGRLHYISSLFFFL
jgi:hypothetical protein